MKKSVKIFSVMVMLIVLLGAFPVKASMADQIFIDEETGFKCKEIVSDFDADPDFEWEKEIMVYIDSEDDLFKLNHNPNYRYIYHYEKPSLKRAVCYNCGKSTMSTVTDTSQWGHDNKECPMTGAYVMEGDLYYTWRNTTYERCTACNYKSASWHTWTYTVKCSNGAGPPASEHFTVLEKEAFFRGNYDVHQYKPWWDNKELPY